MLRCFAGICGGSGRSPAVAAEGQAEVSSGVEVAKPILQVDEDEAPTAASFQQLLSKLPRIPLELAPPGEASYTALVTADFPRNTRRVLVLLPSGDAPEGSWDVAAADSRGNAARLIRWAQANDYAVCLFSAQALAIDPAAVWENVLRRTPASNVTVAVAAGQLPVLFAALRPLHLLLLRRYRTICAPFDGAATAVAWPPPALLHQLPTDTAAHLCSAVVRTPAAWAQEEPREVARRLFEFLQLREDRFVRGEAKKYEGFQDMKENDMPGLRRMNVDQRLQRLDRDRGDDELARLLAKNAKADLEDAEDVPDID